MHSIPTQRNRTITASFTLRSLKRLLFSLALTASVSAATYEKSGGGFVNGGFGQIGNADPQYDALLFKDRSPLELYFEHDLRYTQNAFYSVWEDLSFNKATATNRMEVRLLGTAFDSGRPDLSGGYRRTLSISDMTLNQVDLNSYSVNLNFLGNDNSLTLNDSTMSLGYIDMKPQATAPMHLDVRSGTNQLTAWSGNISPSLFTLDIASGASLELYYSGNLRPSAPSQRLNFNRPIQGTIGGTLYLHYSNVYMNSNQNLRFTTGSSLRLGGSESVLEVEESRFEGSNILLGSDTTFQSNGILTLIDTDIHFNPVGILQTDNVILTQGDILLKGSGPMSGIRGTGLLHMNDLGGTTHFTQQDISSSVLDYLIIKTGSTLDLQHTQFVINSQLIASGTPVIKLHSSTFRLNGFSGGNSSAFDLHIDAHSLFSLSKNHIWQQTASRTVHNDGTIEIDGTFAANGSIGGDGTILIQEDGVMELGVSNSSVHSFTTHNDLIFKPSSVPALPSPNGGTLRMQLDLSGGSASNDTIFYGNGDVTLTQMRELKVDLTQAFSADALDGHSFTLIQAQAPNVAGTLIGATSAPLVEGPSIPALIDFTLSDENTKNKPDLTLNAQKQGNHVLMTHPGVTTANQTNAAQLTSHAANNGNSAVSSALNQLTNGQVGSHLHSIHPEPYSSYMTVSLEHADQIINAVLGRSAGNRRVHANHFMQQTDLRTKDQFWMTSGYTDGEVDGSSGLGDFDYDLTHLTLGQDLLNTERGAGGFYLNYSRQAMDEHDLAEQDIDGEHYHIGLYLSALQIEGLQIDALLGYAYGNHESRRRAQLGNQAGRLNASYDSHSVYTGARASLRAYANDWISLYPELGLHYIYYWQESFTESGNPALALKLDSADAQAIVASAGIQARFASLLQNTSLFPLAFVRYEYDLYANSNSQHDIDAGLANQAGPHLRFVGQNRGQDILSLGAGLGSELSDALQVNAGIRHTHQSNGKELSAQFELSYLW